MVDISKVVTPGEFMLQAAAVRGDASAAIGRGMMVGAQQKENQQRMDLLKQQMETEQNAMNSFAEWQNSLQSIKDPIERMRALGTVPIRTLAYSRVSQAYSGIVNQTRAEYELSQKAEEASGLADERKFRADMYNKWGMPPNASLGSAEWNDAISKENESRKRAFASTLGLQSVPEIAPNTPTGKWGLLDMNDVALQWRKAAPGTITGTTETTPGGTIRRDVSMSMGEQMSSLRTQRAATSDPEEQKRIDTQIADLEKNLQTLIPLRDQSGKVIPGMYYSPAFRTPVDTRSTIFKATGAMPVGMDQGDQEETEKEQETMWGKFLKWEPKF